GEKPESPFQAPVHQFHRVCVESRAGQLDEPTLLRIASGSKFHPRQIDGGFAPAPNHRPRAVQVQRHADFTRKDVDGAERKDPPPRASKTLRLVADPIEHLVQSAIASGGDNDLKALAHRFRGERASTALRCGWFERALRANVVEVAAKPFRTSASGRWIENNANAHCPYL